MNKITFLILAVALVASFLFLAVLLIASCKRTTTEYSDPLEEPATVVDLIFTPSSHSTSVDPTINFDGSMGMAVSSHSVPERWGVVFQCQHGKFIVMGKKEKHKVLWELFFPGENVMVSYREVYRVTREDGEVVSRERIDYDFLSASSDGPLLEAE
jgi:hypothetical protein